MVRLNSNGRMNTLLTWGSLIGLFVFVPIVAAQEPQLTPDYAASWGPEVGTFLPVLEAPDQQGRIRELSNLTGEQGQLLVLSRSADW